MFTKSEHNTENAASLTHIDLRTITLSHTISHKHTSLTKPPWQAHRRHILTVMITFPSSAYMWPNLSGSPSSHMLHKTDIIAHHSGAHIQCTKNLLHSIRQVLHTIVIVPRKICPRQGPKGTMH